MKARRRPVQVLAQGVWTPGPGPEQGLEWPQVPVPQAPPQVRRGPGSGQQRVLVLAPGRPLGPSQQQLLARVLVLVREERPPRPLGSLERQRVLQGPRQNPLALVD